MNREMKQNLADFYRRFVKPHLRYGGPAVLIMLLTVLLQMPMPLITRYIIDITHQPSTSGRTFAPG